MGPGFSRRARAFSLLEVLVALAIATTVLAVLLNSASIQTLRIARMDTRYQALLTASALLQKAGDQRFKGEESGERGEFKFKVDTGTVPADPRVDRLRAEVEGPRGIRVSLEAYRLRAQHQDPGSSQGSR